MEKINAYHDKFKLNYFFFAKWLLLGLVVGGVIGVIGLAESGLTIDGIQIWRFM